MTKIRRRWVTSESRTPIPGVRIVTIVTVILHRIAVPTPIPLAAGQLRVEAVTADNAVLPGIQRLLAASMRHPDGCPTPSARGLAADLHGRSHRTVRAWAAVRHDDHVIGLIGLAEVIVGAGRRLSIPWLVVDPDERRRGVGTHLVRVALDSATAAGGEAVFVETLSGWPAATAFWARISGNAAAGR